MDYPADWKIKKLGDCVTENLSYGINAPAIPYSINEPKYIRITDITEDGKYNDTDIKSVAHPNCERYSLHYGDIVMARTGASVGKSYCYDIRDGKLVYAGYLIKASVDCDKFDPRYIAAQLKTPRYWSWVISMSMRSGQPGINSQEYSSFLIPIPPFAEQKAIADTLGTFDAHIKNLSELIEKKKAIRDGALEDLMSGKIRLKGFSGDWAVKKLGGEYSIIMGQSPSSSSYNQDKKGLPLIQGNADIKNGIIFTERYTSQPTKICEANTTILSGRAPVGTVNQSDQKVCLGRGVCAIIGEISNFIYYLMKYNEKSWKKLEQGSTFTAVSRKVINDFEIFIPKDKTEQQAIAETLTAFDNEIKALEAERDKIIQIRNGAMDDLLTGKVRLKF